MKTEILSILPAGYGHNEVTIRYRNGKQYSAVTSDTSATDDYRGEPFTNADLRKQKAAGRALINIVKRRHCLA
jgi:hypothetical protein